MNQSLSNQSPQFLKSNLFKVKKFKNKIYPHFQALTDDQSYNIKMKRRHASFAGKVALQSYKVLVMDSNLSEIQKKPQQKTEALSKNLQEPNLKSQIPSQKSENIESSQKQIEKGKSNSSQFKDNIGSSQSHVFLLSSSHHSKQLPIQKQVKPEPQEFQKKTKPQSNRSRVSNLLRNLTSFLPKQSKQIEQSEQNNKEEKKQGQNIFSQPDDEKQSQNQAESDEDSIEDIKKTRTRELKANATYRPKNFSQPWNILKTLYLLQAHFKPISMRQIEQKYKTIKESPFRYFHNHKDRLVVNGYIAIEKDNSIRLVERGEKFIAPRANLVQVSKEKTDEPKKQITHKSTEGKSKKSRPNHSSSEPKPQKVDQKPKYKYFDTQLSYEGYPKQKIAESKNADKVKLLINQNASSIMQSRLCDFTTKLQEEAVLKFALGRLHTNINFFFEADNKILDCFVVFIKGLKTDLQFIKYAISDGKYCNTSKLILLAELNYEKQRKTSRRFHKDEEYFEKVKKQMQKFLFDARAAGLSVFETINQEETIAFLKKLNSLLSKKIRHISDTGETVNHYGQIDKLNQWFKISKAYNHRRITVKCMKRIRGLSNQSIKRFAQKLPTLGLIYTKMQKLDSNEQRVRFLDWLLQNHESDRDANKILVELLFLEDYNLEKKVKVVKRQKKVQQQQYKSNDSYIA